MKKTSKESCDKDTRRDAAIFKDELVRSECCKLLRLYLTVETNGNLTQEYVATVFSEDQTLGSLTQQFETATDFVRGRLRSE